MGWLDDVLGGNDDEQFVDRARGAAGKPPVDKGGARIRFGLFTDGLFAPPSSTPAKKKDDGDWLGSFLLFRRNDEGGEARKELGDRAKSKVLFRAASMAERLPEDFSAPGVMLGRKYIVAWSRRPYGKVKRKSFRSQSDARAFAQSKGGALTDARQGRVIWPVRDEDQSGKPSDGGHVWWGWGGD
jgi:hypothetical protein